MDNWAAGAISGALDRIAGAGDQPGPLWEINHELGRIADALERLLEILEPAVQGSHGGGASHIRTLDVGSD